MRFKALLGSILLTVSTAAHADMTAVYAMTAPNAPPGAPFLTLQIAANGDVHGTMVVGNIEFIVHDGHGFTILKGPSGPIVSRVEDVATVMSERIDKIVPGGFSKAAEAARSITYTLNGTETVNGRTGDAYYAHVPNGPADGALWAVISHDPKLAPLGRAMADEFAMSMKIMGTQLPSDAFQPMLDVLRKGAPLQMTGIQLQSVSDAPVPASAFVLPAPPQTLDQVRARMANGGLKTSG